MRKWKSGDKIQPLGMKGSKKVSDILIDYKISILEKENIYVLESNNDIIWVIGILINDKYKVDNNCSLYCTGLFIKKIKFTVMNTTFY